MNDNYEQFDQVTEENEIVLYLRHKKTGLEIEFHKSEADETEFSFNFKTPVEDPYLGTTHVLEHCVLEGSKKYKANFLDLRNLSCYSELNGLTFDIYTQYYFNSPIQEEVFKMIPILGDYVFFPELSEEAFMQECVRVEFDSTGDGRKKYLAGNVYNEMKNEPLKNNYCGGIFYKLHELTNEKIKEYHKKYYRPDNCLFQFTGSCSLDEVLSVLDKVMVEVQAAFENKPEAIQESYIDFSKVQVPPVKTIPQIKAEYLRKFLPGEYKAKLEKLHAWQNRDVRDLMYQSMQPLTIDEYDVESGETEEELQQYFEERKSMINYHFEKHAEVETKIDSNSCCITIKPSTPLSREYYAEYCLCLFLRKFLDRKIRQLGRSYNVNTKFEAPYVFAIFTIRDNNPAKTLNIIKQLIIDMADYDFSEIDLMIIKSAIYSILFSKGKERLYFGKKILEVTAKDLHKAAIRFKELIEAV